MAKMKKLLSQNAGKFNKESLSLERQSGLTRVQSPEESAANQSKLRLAKALTIKGRTYGMNSTSSMNPLGKKTLGA